MNLAVRVTLHNNTYEAVCHHTSMMILISVYMVAVKRPSVPDAKANRLFKTQKFQPENPFTKYSCIILLKINVDLMFLSC